MGETEGFRSLRRALRKRHSFSVVVGELDREAICKALRAEREAGKSFQDMAAALGMPKSTLNYWTRKLGVRPSRVVNGTLTTKHEKNTAFLRRIHLTSGVAYVAGIVVGVSSSTIDL